jgi:hypothetical protein
MRPASPGTAPSRLAGDSPQSHTRHRPDGHRGEGRKFEKEYKKKKVANSNTTIRSFSINPFIVCDLQHEICEGKEN